MQSLDKFLHMKINNGITCFKIAKVTINNNFQMKDSLAVAGQDVEDYGEGTSSSNSWSPIENLTTFTEGPKPVAIPSKTPDNSLTEDVSFHPIWECPLLGSSINSKLLTSALSELPGFCENSISHYMALIKKNAKKELAKILLRFWQDLAKY
jgi:hypothetical protein